MLSDLPPGTEDYDGEDSVIPKIENAPSKESRDPNIDKFIESRQISFTDGTTGPMFGFVDDEDQAAFLCYPCGATCYSEISLQDHLNGRKHSNKILSKKVWLKSIVNDHPYKIAHNGEKPTASGEQIVESNVVAYFNNIKSSLIGLEYVVEVIDTQNDSLVCTLCDKKGLLSVISNHLTSTKHKLKYFNIHFPSVYRLLEKYRGHNQYFQTSMEILNSICDKIETDHGRQKPVTVLEGDFEADKAKYIKMATSARHISERDGRSYVEMVDDALITAMVRKDPPSTSASAASDTTTKPIVEKPEPPKDVSNPHKIVRDDKERSIKITLSTKTLPKEEVKDLREDLNERRARKDLRDEIERISSNKHRGEYVSGRDSPFSKQSRSPYTNRSPSGLYYKDPEFMYSSRRGRSRSPGRLHQSEIEAIYSLHRRERSPYRRMSPRSRSPARYRRSPPFYGGPRKERSPPPRRISPRRSRSPYRRGSPHMRMERSPRKYFSPPRREASPSKYRNKSPDLSPLSTESPPISRKISPKVEKVASKSSPIIIEDFFKMPFQEFRNMDLRELGIMTKKNLQKATLFHERYVKVVNTLQSALEFHEKNPERHPLYQEEWKKFWNKRYKELKNEKVDVNTYNFKPEWIVYWSGKIKEMHKKELDVKKDEICRRLNLTSNDKELMDLFQVTLDHLVQFAKKSKNPPPIIQELLKNEEKEWKEAELKIEAEKRKFVEIKKRQKLVDYPSERSRSGSVKDYHQELSRASPISEEGWSDESESTILVRERVGSKKPRIMAKERIQAKAVSGYSDAIKTAEEDVNVISVLRLLTALENYLGSLGSKVLNLLALALKMEKEQANSSEKILTNEDHCMLFETVKEKLKGLLLAGLIDSPAVQATKKAIQYTASLVHIASKLVEEEKKKEETQSIPQKAVPVEGIGVMEKAAIAHQIASTLIAQGRTNVTTEELESLVNTVVGMVDKDEAKKAKQKNAAAVKETASNMTTANALQMLQSAYASQSAAPKKPVVEEESPPAIEGLSDSDLQTLLQNFEDLSADEQNGLIAYLKNLEKKDPDRVETLQKFISHKVTLEDTVREKSPLLMREKKGESNEKNPVVRINKEVVKKSNDSEEEDDDYNFDDVLKSASAKVKESQLQEALEVVQKSLSESKSNQEKSSVNVNLIMSKLLSAQQEQSSNQNTSSSTSKPDLSYENISNVLGLVATLSNPTNSVSTKTDVVASSLQNSNIQSAGPSLPSGSNMNQWDAQNKMQNPNQFHRTVDNDEEAWERPGLPTNTFEREEGGNMPMYDVDRSRRPYEENDRPMYDVNSRNRMPFDPNNRSRMPLDMNRDRMMSGDRDLMPFEGNDRMMPGERDVMPFEGNDRMMPGNDRMGEMDRGKMPFNGGQRGRAGDMPNRGGMAFNQNDRMNFDGPIDSGVPYEREARGGVGEDNRGMMPFDGAGRGRMMMNRNMYGNNNYNNMDPNYERGLMYSDAPYRNQGMNDQRMGWQNPSYDMNQGEMYSQDGYAGNAMGMEGGQGFGQMMGARGGRGRGGGFNRRGNFPRF